MMVNRKKRILVWGLTSNQGGTEAVVSNWMRVLESKYEFDFIGHELLSHDYCTCNGRRVYVLPNRRKRYFAFQKALTDFFKEHADVYSAFWFNANNLSNIDPLRCSYRFGVPKRILHAHNSQWMASAFAAKMSELHRSQASHLATDRIACSAEAGRLFFGDAPFEVFPNAFNLQSYRFSLSDRSSVRRELGLAGKHVIGTVGRLTSQKNHQFLIQLMPEILRKNRDSHLVIVGAGDLEGKLRSVASSLNVAEHVHLIGVKDNVPAILSSFDVFAFPSLFEGLGNAIVEAQINGLPCIASTGVPCDAIISRSANRVPLEDDGVWVKYLSERNRDSFYPENGKEQLFDLDRQAVRIMTLFEE